MRVLFYLLDGDTNASSRQRVIQYMPFLARHGIEGRVSRPVPPRLYQRWLENGRGTAREKAQFYALFWLNRVRDVWRANAADVVVIQRDLFPFGPPVLERLLRRRNPRIAYDTDDATWIRPAFTPNTIFQRMRDWAKPAEVAANARWVSAATEPIADWARQYAHDVTVVPMAIDPTEYRCMQPRARDTLVLGWAGTPGGLRYLQRLAPVLREVSKRHQVVLRVVSGRRPTFDVPGVHLDWRCWRADRLIEDIASFDVGLVPLDDSPFERAKFPFKLLQYMALGIPSVSARVGVVRRIIDEGRNGLLADSPEAWGDALERLVQDIELRRRIGAAGRELVMERYTVERVGPLLLDGLARAART
ncbi:MAG: glycosyltransferase [Chloroflexi bacterium]|nr:glycosyltransferase [Chloroflexota bacterium]